MALRENSNAERGLVLIPVSATCRAEIRANQVVQRQSPTRVQQPEQLQILWMTQAGADELELQQGLLRWASPSDEFGPRERQRQNTVTPFDHRSHPAGSAQVLDNQVLIFPTLGLEQIQFRPVCGRPGAEMAEIDGQRTLCQGKAMDSGGAEESSQRNQPGWVTSDHDRRTFSPLDPCD